MFQACWLPIRESQISYKLIAGVFILICLHPLFGQALPSNSHSIVTIEKIRELEEKNQGNVKRRFHAWKNLIETNSNKPELGQLSATNNFFNQFTFSSDIQYQGEEDYWKAPDEFIVDGGGDCEDFSIAKYFTLLTMGIPIEKLRITYVKSLKLNQAHMVLAYYPQPEADPLILDNLNNQILPASKRTDLTPVYSFNGDGLWLAKTRSGDRRLGESNGLGKWRQVIERMKKGRQS